MAPSDSLASPSPSKVALSFSIGILLGVAMAVPAIPAEVAAVSVERPGPVGSVLLAGVLSVVVVTVGLFGLYRLFWLVDR